MYPILLSDLANFNEQLLAEYLQPCLGNQYNIIIPRLNKADKNDDPAFTIFWDYYSAAYAGQLLKNSSVSFAMFIPCPLSKEPFSFQVTINDRLQLIKLLCIIEGGYYQHDKQMLRFHEEAAKYFQGAFEGEIDSDCWGLLAIANDFLCST